MKLTLITFMVLSLSTMPALAQQMSPAQAKRVRAGTAKMWAGVALAGVDAVVMPITGVPYSGDTQQAVGATLIGAGAVLFVLGGRDRARATNPQRTFEVSLGKRKAIVLRRSW